MTLPIYAIGDIHGDLDQLLAVHRRIKADAADRKIEESLVLHIGDLVDRQPNSKEVIDYLIAGHAKGEPWITLKGNHDRMMAMFLLHGQQDPCLRPDYTWLHHRLGGMITLQSYGVVGMEDRSEADIRVEALERVPSEHLAFLEGLPLYHETEQVYFTHAGIIPEVALPDQTEDALLWIRQQFHDYQGMHPKLIVNGHTPVDEVTHYGNRVNIDTGAAYGRVLSVVVVTGGEVEVLEEGGRKELRPSG